MDATQFDAMVWALRARGSRRGAVGGVVGAALALLGVAGPGAAKRRHHRDAKRRHPQTAKQKAPGCKRGKGGNSACAHFCAAVFGADTAAAGQCTSEGAKCQGVCAQCGPGCTANCQTLCGQQCVDAQTDVNHCGASCTACTGDDCNAPACLSGTCGTTPVNAGGSCDGGTGTCTGGQCQQGCSPRYWRDHTGPWASTGYSPSQTVGSVFTGAAAFPSLASQTLLQALQDGGGPGTLGAAQDLLQAAVAALLNVAHPDVDYPRTVAAVLADVNSALESGDRNTMLTLAVALDHDNARGCPLPSVAP
jgi:hypothetical protein